MPIITGRTLKAPDSGFFLFGAGCIIKGQNHEKGAQPETGIMSQNPRKFFEGLTRKSAPCPQIRVNAVHICI